MKSHKNMQLTELSHIRTGDAFADMLTELIERFKPRTILDIGSSDGTGSTSVIIDAIRDYGADLYCIEMEKDRVEKLVENTAHYPFVHCYHAASVPVTGMVEYNYIWQFKRQHPRFPWWKMMTRKEIDTWYYNSIRDIQAIAIPNGIEHIKKQNHIEHFDMVLIDGSPFTGMAELTAVYGADIIFMDDTFDLKSYDASERLKRDPMYETYHINNNYRNGFAVFKKRVNANS